MGNSLRRFAWITATDQGDISFMSRFLRRCALVVIAASALALPSVAGAQSAEELRQEAARLEAEISANADQLSVLNEQVKGVQLRLDEANAVIADAESGIEAAKREANRLLQLIRERAAAVYRSRGAPSGEEFLAPDPETLASREKYAAAASAEDAELKDDFDAARQDLRVRRRDAEDAREKAEAEKTRLDAAQAEFQTANAQREQLLAQVRGELADLVAQEAARRAASQAPKNFDPGGLPPAPGGGAGAAVAYAAAQVGKPYCYAGVGPACFDCSGLTMMAWRQGGVSMAHNDSAQINAFPAVSRDQLQPGDLAWFPGHIAIYAGNGAVIVSPRTGDFVKYQSVNLYQRFARPG
jgi:cell wall-associated NlpC family hydrolase